LIAGGHLTTGELIAFILYIDLFFSPIQQLSQVFDAWQQTRVSVARIAELMAIETRTPAAAEPVVPGRLSGHLTLEGVRFGYPTAPPRPPLALDGLSLHVKAGETVALVGETGAGKSTVMKLLGRFYDPDEGRVLVDGLDLRTLDTAASSAMCPRRRSSSPAPCGTTSPTGGRRPPMPRWRPRPGPSAPTRSSPPCRAGTSRSSTSGGSRSPPASAS